MTTNEQPEIDIAFITTNEITAWKQPIALRFFGKAARMNLFLDINTGYSAEVEHYYEGWSIADKENFADWLLNQENLKKLDEQVSYAEHRAPGTIESKYQGTTRTNYFAVKDLPAFESELKDLCRNHLGNSSFRLIHAGSPQEPTCAVLFYTKELWLPDREGSQWAALVRRHLKDDWVSIIMHVGSEGFESLHAEAHAYNSKGEIESVNLARIEEQARRIGRKVTETSF
jgi:hypothetical protein